MFLKNRHAKKIYKVGKSSRNTSNVKFHACVSIVHDWNLCFTKLVVFLFPDTTVTFKNAQVIWSRHIMLPFTICACCYSGLRLKNHSVKTLVAEDEIRTSNLCHMPCT